MWLAPFAKFPLFVHSLRKLNQASDTWAGSTPSSRGCRHKWCLLRCSRRGARGWPARNPITPQLLCQRSISSAELLDLAICGIQLSLHLRGPTRRLFSRMLRWILLFVFACRTSLTIITWLPSMQNLLQFLLPSPPFRCLRPWCWIRCRLLFSV